MWRCRINDGDTPAGRAQLLLSRFGQTASSSEVAQGDTSPMPRTRLTLLVPTFARRWVNARRRGDLLGSIPNYKGHVR